MDIISNKEKDNMSKFVELWIAGSLSKIFSSKDDAMKFVKQNGYKNFEIRKIY